MLRVLADKDGSFLKIKHTVSLRQKLKVLANKDISFLKIKPAVSLR
jgi:hypothetical protein